MAKITVREKYKRLLTAATSLAKAVNEAHPFPFPGDPLGEALSKLDDVVKENEGIKQDAFYFLERKK